MQKAVSSVVVITFETAFFRGIGKLITENYEKRLETIKDLVIGDKITKSLMIYTRFQ